MGTGPPRHGVKENQPAPEPGLTGRESRAEHPAPQQAAGREGASAPTCHPGAVPQDPRRPRFRLGDRLSAGVDALHRQSTGRARERAQPGGKASAPTGLIGRCRFARAIPLLLLPVVFSLLAADAHAQAPTVSISFGPGTNGHENHDTNGNVPVRFKVVLEPPATVPVTVDYATFDDTAVSGKDYRAQSSTLTFAPGETEKTVEVAVLNDDIVEDDQSLGLRLSNASASGNVGVAITDSEETRTIASEDRYSLSFNSPSEAEGRRRDIKGLTFRATLSKAADFDVQLDLLKHADGGTAIAGEDYYLPFDDPLKFAKSQTFEPGETQKVIRVRFRGDSRAEPDETVVFRGLLGSHCALPDNLQVDCFAESGGNEAIAEGTIRNDDGHDFSVSDQSNGYENHPDNGNVPARFTVELHPAAPVPVTVRYKTAEQEDFDEGSSTWESLATSGEDYPAADANGTLTFAPGETEKTVEVAVIDDDIVEDDNDLFLLLSEPSASSSDVEVGISGGGLGWAQIVSEDRYTLSVDSPSVNEGQSTDSTDLPLTVRLSNPVQGRTVTVDYTLGGTATAGTDYTGPVSGTLRFASEQTET